MDCSGTYELDVQEDCSFTLRSQHEACGTGSGMAFFTGSNEFIGL